MSTTADTTSSASAEGAPGEVNLYLSGNFAPVREEVTAFDLPVEGALPPELRGLYVRNGANPKTGHSEHWFLGHGMVHGVRIEDGRAAWYRNRYVRTPFFDEPDVPRISSTGEADYTRSAANTHVLAHAGRILDGQLDLFSLNVDFHGHGLGERNDFGWAICADGLRHVSCP